MAVVAATALTVTGCATTMTVSSHAARGLDFARYRTYDWKPVEAFATGDPRLDNNPFFHERLQATVDQQLQARRFEKATSATPDLLLHYHAHVSQRVDPDPADQRYGYSHDFCLRVYEAGTIVLDVVDTRTNRLVWRGWAEGSVDGVIDDQDWMEKRIDEAVARILRTFPRRPSAGAIGS